MDSLAVPITRAPRSRANWTAAIPTPPAAPLTISVWPSARSRSFSTRSAVSTATGVSSRLGPAQTGRLGRVVVEDRELRGRAADRAAEDLVADAHVDHPIAELVDDAGDVAAGRCVANASGTPPAIAPLRIFQSIGLTPAALTATRIWPAAACGSSTSSTAQDLRAPVLGESHSLHLEISSRPDGRPSTR